MLETSERLRTGHLPAVNRLIGLGLTLLLIFLAVPVQAGGIRSPHEAICQPAIAGPHLPIDPKLLLITAF